jgi:hypothetical protein
LDLPGAMMINMDATLPAACPSPWIWAKTREVAMSASGINKNSMVKIMMRHQLLKDSLGHWGAAEVSHADKEHFDLIFSRSSIGLFALEPIFYSHGLQAVKAKRWSDILNLMDISS